MLQQSVLQDYYKGSGGKCKVFQYKDQSKCNLQAVFKVKIKANVIHTGVFCVSTRQELRSV